MEETERKQPHKPFRLLRWLLILAALGLAAFVSIIFFNALAPVQAPLGGARPDLALLALINAPAKTTESTPTHSTTTPSTSTLTLSTKSTQSTSSTLSTVPTTTTQPAYELIPESELAKPEQKAAARRFNESFRKWLDLLGRFEQDPIAFQKRPNWEQEVYGPNGATYGIRGLMDELSLTGLGPKYLQKLSDTYLQLMAHYGEWGSAANHCMIEIRYRSWGETLYCLRRIPKTGQRISCIVVYSAMRPVIPFLSKLHENDPGRADR